MTEYHPVTKEELDMIKNDCAYPEKPYCEGCAYCDENEDITRASGFGCQFKGANVLMEEVLSRPDPLALLEAWVEHNKRRYIGDRGEYDFFSSDDLNIILKQLRTNPDELCDNKSCPRGYQR